MIEIWVGKTLVNCSGFAIVFLHHHFAPYDIQRCFGNKTLELRKSTEQYVTVVIHRLYLIVLLRVVMKCELCVVLECFSCNLLSLLNINIATKANPGMWHYNYYSIAEVY